MRRDRLTQQTLGNSEIHNVSDICDIEILPHKDPEADMKYEIFQPPDGEYPDADEQVGEIERVGIAIAKSIHDQSEQFGRKKKFD